jgi:hypothetical protein
LFPCTVKGNPILTFPVRSAVPFIPLQNERKPDLRSKAVHGHGCSRHETPRAMQVSDHQFKQQINRQTIRYKFNKPNIKFSFCMH